MEEIIKKLNETNDIKDELIQDCSNHCIKITKNFQYNNSIILILRWNDRPIEITLYESIE